VIVLALLALPLLAQGEVVHGADSVFASPSVGIVWAVLRGPTEEQTIVVTRIRNSAARYGYVRVEGVDPFTGRRAAVVEGIPVGATADVTSPRSSFADLPRRDIHLYTSEADWRARKPTLTVYYLGVPDTTPEFTSRADLDAYLARIQPRDR
jgi:hypothetical protein